MTHQHHSILNTAGLICSTIILCLSTQPLFAAAYQSHKSIYQTAKIFMAKHISENYQQPATITIGRLDNRLRLKQCNQPITAFLPTGSRDIGRTSIGVKCNGNNPWSLHVSVTVSMFKTIAVASKLLPRGTVLGKHDIRMKKIDLSTLPQGYINNASALLGLKLKRRLAAGAAFTPTGIEKPQCIKRGQRITIVARTGNMEVRMAGKALSSGSIGDHIRVINLSSKQKREGFITPACDVQINP